MIKNIIIGVIAFIIISTFFSGVLSFIGHQVDCRTFNQRGQTAF
jgi:hypothetical protein